MGEKASETGQKEHRVQRPGEPSPWVLWIGSAMLLNLILASPRLDIWFAGVSRVDESGPEFIVIMSSVL